MSDVVIIITIKSGSLEMKPAWPICNDTYYIYSYMSLTKERSATENGWASTRDKKFRSYKSKPQNSYNST